MGAKEYEMPNGRKVVFEFDENGVGNITLEAMDLLMGMVNIDLVRCGECIHRHEHEWYNTCDKHIGHGFEDDYFCKDGERNSKNNSNRI